jgi:hypothetical protein
MILGILLLICLLLYHVILGYVESVLLLNGTLKNSRKKMISIALDSFSYKQKN